MESYTPTYISTQTTTLIKTGNGTLHNIVIGETAAGSITVYDGIDANGTVKAVLKSSVVEGTYTFDFSFVVGLTVVTGAGSKLTVNFK